MDIGGNGCKKDILKDKAIEKTMALWQGSSFSGRILIAKVQLI